ncbi:sigma-70 family RNA polymerase sigma factor [Cytobacillus sp. IB215665]|uniref:sigma-70 family RNA polymerase sigma factor n=1 Tax=Cytobacillus sp. IB215665 TaxID=3097357 RepID=UPI002A16BE3C|nr:sigma-70 family RNA polymerase sigma factor [Cytobacillus sp. IB215665]MDX8366078.1 sigma-70 family RNA polymerase sigma factor [Cytobacillus sp. IB215665]
MSDDKLFEQMIHQYRPMILTIMRKLHLYKNFDHYYQSALIALWQANDKFDSEKGIFSTYAYATIQGKLLSELTKENRVESRFLCMSDENLQFLAGSYVDIETEHESLLMYCEVLTTNQQKWLLGTFLYGKKLQHIASEEGVSIAAVKSWRRHALAKLRKTFTPPST